MKNQEALKLAELIDEMQRELPTTEKASYALDQAELERCATLISELSWKTTPYDAVVVVSELNRLHAKDDPQRSLNEIFQSVANHASASYPEHPSDVDILSNVATPALLRWTLSGLRQYAATTYADPSDMAKAFGIRRSRTGPREGLEQHAKALVAVGVSVYRKARLTMHPEQAMDVATEAAFQAYIPLRKSDAVPTKRESEALRDKLWKMIDSVIPTWK